MSRAPRACLSGECLGECIADLGLLEPRVVVVAANFPEFPVQVVVQHRENVATLAVSTAAPDN
jgi:hypothetical protein